MSQRLIVGVTGASGACYGIKLLELLKPTSIETHLVISKAGEMTRSLETSVSHDDLVALADHVHAPGDIAAPISSGSFKTLGMIVAPCSMHSLAEIATGVASSLLTRSADVVLKERRRLVLMVRETPLSLVHLRNMQAVTEAGAVVFPPVPSFYNEPQSLDDLVTYSAVRALDLFDIEVAADVKRWG